MTAQDEAFRHCEALVRAHDRDRYLASLFAPAPARRHLFALYAFDYETARVRDVVREPMAGAIRLQWWREVVEGERPGEAAASPVAAAITATLAETGIDRAPLLGMIEARRAALFGEPANPVAPKVFLAAALLLGSTDGATMAAADDAGLAWGAPPEEARAAYARFRARAGGLPDGVLPAFLPVALVPLRLRKPDAPAWRRQLVLLRAAYFGFAKID